MTEEIVIVLPELKGGVGDYTGLLLEHLPHISNLRLIVPKVGSRPANSFEQYPVEETNASARDLCNRLPIQGGKVLLQYSAYGFSRTGYPRWLIHALLDWKTRSGGTLVIMFHEIWTFWPILNRNFILQQLHRSDLRKLLRLADAVFTSTQSQAEHLNALSARSPTKVLPVGSNIRPAEIQEPRERGVAAIFGLQSSRIRLLRIMGSSLKSLSAAGRIRKIVTAGSGSSAQGDKDEQAALLNLELIDGFEQRGPLPEMKISELLSTSEFGISAQDELSITKSSTFMAFAAHGLNVLSCYAEGTKSEPFSLMISPDELLNGVTLSDLQSRGERLRQWQERTSSWSHIAGEIGRALKI